jgi:hypothetical protein
LPLRAIFLKRSSRKVRLIFYDEEQNPCRSSMEFSKSLSISGWG